MTPAELDNAAIKFYNEIDGLSIRLITNENLRDIFKLRINYQKIEGNVSLCFKREYINTIPNWLKENIEGIFNAAFPAPEGLPVMLTHPCPEIPDQE